MSELKKLEMKLKMMEISFEQINNSRNDMIGKLAEMEMLVIEVKAELEATQDMYVAKVRQCLKLEEQLAIK